MSSPITHLEENQLQLNPKSIQKEEGMKKGDWVVAYGIDFECVGGNSSSRGHLGFR